MGSLGVASKRLWLALGAGAYIAFVLARLPAGAYSWFAPNTVSLAGVDGTLWSGRAELGSVGGLAVRDVAWRISPWHLWLARAAGRAEARLAEGFVATEFSAGLRRTELTELQASTSLPVLAPIMPVQGTFGLVSASFASLALEDEWPVEAVGQVRLQQLEVTPLVPTGDSALVPLGDYEITFRGGEHITAEVHDSGGPLEVAATLTLDRDRNYVLEGTVRPRANASKSLVQALQLMTGEPDAAGRRALGLTGSL